MIEQEGALTPTPRGDVWCVLAAGAAAFRVGYPPTSWEWTPWEYATGGRFSGRWDDPSGVWRTLYVGSSLLACYLEVLAYARPSDELTRALDEISEEDGEQFPSVEPGHVPRSWMKARISGSGAIDGWFVVPGHPESMATLRTAFRGQAIRLGLMDLDTAAIRDGRPRALTQEISSWINTQTGPDREMVAGIQFESRHGDGLKLWAIYERPGDSVVSANVTQLEYGPVLEDDPDLVEAMRLHHLVWDDV
ncbi:RES domain-containing protein [Rhodococcoides kyotonense]|uniref:RES domain-containing protein n=1 Tax=Rhodococcoides kyotonense TaxID=398843 RepID=A0A239MDW4_9NOCA|nr:RES domain-containing protein [Rhodococcus kyotonensis]SNT40846.1 RES domain-containing protein [Rhodococcus kyotonensis]